jgi:hypothetical protein
MDTVLHGSPVVNIHLFGSNECTYAFVSHRIHRSLDSGGSWTLARSALRTRGLQSLSVDESEALCLQWNVINDTTVSWSTVLTTNSGDSWQFPIQVTVPHEVFPQEIGLTRTNSLILGITSSNALWISLSDRDGNNRQPFQHIMESEPGNSLPPFLYADARSDYAGILQAVGGSSWYSADLRVFRSEDQGLTWGEPQMLTTGRPVGATDAEPEMFGRNNLWGVVWHDYWNPDTTQRVIYCRLSANHGKDWYPAQLIYFDLNYMSYSSGQFIGNEMRIYWMDNYGDYGSATGIMAPDTLRPVMDVLHVPDSSATPNQVAQFIVRPTDNDTLSEVRLFLDWGTGHVFTYPMNRSETGRYFFNFLIPREAEYRYRIESEDFWENVGCYPDTGWASFHTANWDAADPRVIVQPASFSVSVFPNPCNGWPSLKLSADWFEHGPVSLTVRDLLGRTLWSRGVNPSTSVLPLQDAGAAAYVSGIYVLTVSRPGRTTHVKFLALR